MIRQLIYLLNLQFTQNGQKIAQDIIIRFFKFAIRNRKNISESCGTGRRTHEPKQSTLEIVGNED